MLRGTTSIVDIQGRKRIGRISVIRGGLYKPPVGKPKDYLGEEFRAFLKKERAETGETSGI